MTNNIGMDTCNSHYDISYYCGAREHTKEIQITGVQFMFYAQPTLSISSSRLQTNEKEGMKI